MHWGLTLQVACGLEFSPCPPVFLAFPSDFW